MHILVGAVYQGIAVFVFNIQGNEFWSHVHAEQNPWVKRDQTQ